MILGSLHLCYVKNALYDVHALHDWTTIVTCTSLFYGQHDQLLYYQIGPYLPTIVLCSYVSKHHVCVFAQLYVGEHNPNSDEKQFLHALKYIGYASNVSW